MDKQCAERVKELMKEMEKKNECEEYDECKIIKNEIDQLKNTSALLIIIRKMALIKMRNKFWN